MLTLVLIPITIPSKLCDFDMAEGKLDFEHWYFRHLHADEDITERHALVGRNQINSTIV